MLSTLQRKIKQQARRSKQRSVAEWRRGYAMKLKAVQMQLKQKKDNT